MARTLQPCPAVSNPVPPLFLAQTLAEHFDFMGETHKAQSRVHWSMRELFVKSTGV